MRSRGGFTLTDLAIVLIILGAGAALGLTVLRGLRRHG